jgi:neuronal growth regulator 1
VKKEDRGTYYCVADNGVGKPARRNVAVEVEFPPSVGGGGRLGQAMGYSVEMVCHVEAYPRPTITWVHEGIQLSTNQVHNLKNKIEQIPSVLTCVHNWLYKIAYNCVE